MRKIELAFTFFILILIVCACGASPIEEAAPTPVEEVEEATPTPVQEVEDGAPTPVEESEEAESAPPEEAEIDSVGIVSLEIDVVEHGHDESSLIQLFGSSDLLSGDWLSVHDGGAGRLDFGDGMLLRVFNDTMLQGIRAELVAGIPLDVQMFLVEGGLTGRLDDFDGEANFTTPGDAQISILGTEFFIIYDPDSEQTVAGNFGGTVEVSSAGSTAMLESGHFVQLPAGIPPGRQRPFKESLAVFEQRAIELQSPIAAYEELACQDTLELVEGLNVAHEFVLPPGAPFLISWHVRNSGYCDLNDDYVLQFVAGEPMTSETAVPLDRIVNSGERGSVSVTLVAPDEPGDYYGTWQLVGPWGRAFGPPLEVAVTVAEPTPTVTPTYTPIPTEVPCSRPSIVTAVTDANVRGGPGTNYNAVGTLRSGERAEVIGRNSRAPRWWRIAVPRLAGNHLWIAEWVVSFDGDPACIPPAPIPPPPTPQPEPEPTPYAIFPPETISADARCGRCTELHWRTEYVDAVYLNGEPVPLTGSHNACIASEGAYSRESQLTTSYHFLAEAPGWRDEQTTRVIWTSPALRFTGYKSEEIGCTDLSWYVEQAEAVYLDGTAVGPQGSKTVCPREPQTFVLKANLGCGTVQREVTVNPPEPPETTPEITPEITPEVTPDITPRITPDIILKPSPEPTYEPPPEPTREEPTYEPPPEPTREEPTYEPPLVITLEPPLVITLEPPLVITLEPPPAITLEPPLVLPAVITLEPPLVLPPVQSQTVGPD